MPGAKPSRQRVRPLRLQLEDWIKDQHNPGHNLWSWSQRRPDFRRAKKLTVDDSYPTPNILDILTSLGSSNFFFNFRRGTSVSCNSK